MGALVSAYCYIRLEPPMAYVNQPTSLLASEAY